MSGRIRSIKPELLEDAKTAGLSDSAFRVFIGLILLADDYGNCRAEPKYLEGQIYWSAIPETSVSSSLKSLETLVTYYNVRGQTYAHINGWDKHQRVQHPGKPRVPGPSERDSGESPESLTRVSLLISDLRPPITDHRSSSPDGAEAPRDGLSTDETTRIRKLTRRKPKTAIPADWSPPSDEHAHSWHQEARRNGLTKAEVETAVRQFKLHHEANGELRADWTASWRLWLSRVRSYGPKFERPQQAKQQPAPAGEYDWYQAKLARDAEAAKKAGGG